MKKLLLISCFLISSCSYAQTKDSRLNGIEKEINKLIKEYNAVGLSVAVVKDNQIIYSKGFGLRDLENKIPVTQNTVFPIGSNTKAFTATLLGMLESENRISLKDKPAKHISVFEFYNDKMNNLITIEDLLCHKSGIGNQGTTEVFFPDKDKLKIVRRLKYLKPEGEVKNSFEYSNMGYTLAGAIIESVTNKSWEYNIQEKIFNQLQMKNSYTSLEAMKKSNNYALPYGIYKGRSEKVKFEHFYSLGPAGGIKSSVIDLSNWMIAWLNNGIFKEKQIIPKEFVNKATILQNIRRGNYEKNSFLLGDGFGWRLSSNYGHYRVRHGGNTFGFSSSLVMFPFEKIGIVALSNQDNSLLPHIVSDIIVRKLFEIDPEPDYPINVAEIFKALPYKDLNKEKMPTHSLDSYCGNYFANGFGTIKITNKDEKLYAELPKFKFLLQHESYNWFFLKPTQDFKEVFSPQFDVRFDIDNEKNITALKLYSQKEPVTFIKMKD